MLWPLISEVHDLDFLAAGKRGVFYTGANPLTLESRAPQERKKQPRI